jgi:YggT family protein
MEALRYILNALLTLLVVAYLLRLLMPVVRADFRNAIGQAVLRVTDPLVKPLRRALPPAGRLDTASLAALLLVQLAGTAIVQLITGFGFDAGLLLAGALYGLLHTVLEFYTVAVLLYALLSWVAPGTYSPANQLLARLCEPLLAPIRRVVPPFGGLDLSALFVLIALQALQILLH